MRGADGAIDVGDVDFTLGCIEGRGKGGFAQRWYVDPCGMRCTDESGRCERAGQIDDRVQRSTAIAHERRSGQTEQRRSARGVADVRGAHVETAVERRPAYRLTIPDTADRAAHRSGAEPMILFGA